MLAQTTIEHKHKIYLSADDSTCFLVVLTHNVYPSTLTPGINPGKLIDDGYIVEPVFGESDRIEAFLNLREQRIFILGSKSAAQKLGQEK